MSAGRGDGTNTHKPARGPAWSDRLWGLAVVVGVGTTTAFGGALLARAQAALTSPVPAVASPASSAASAPDPKLLASLDTAAGRDAFIKQNCLTCHSARAKTAGLVLEGRTTSIPGDNAELWEKVVRRVAAGEMPPPYAHRPDAISAHAFVASLVRDLDLAAKQRPYAGPSVIRRLNRTEYANAVRDLLDVDFPFARELPVDGLADGFDNIGDALSISPVLLESYLKVGRKVSELAVGVADPSAVTEEFAATKGQAQWIGEGAPFGTRGGIVVRKYFPRQGDYELRAFVQIGSYDPTLARPFRFKIHVEPGLHTFVATFPDEYADHEGPVPTLTGQGGPGVGGPLDVQGSAWSPTVEFLLDGRQVNSFDIGGASPPVASYNAEGGPPTMVRAEVTGPYNTGPVVQSASRQKIFICRPRNTSEETPCADRILTTIARRAFRRDVTGEDLRPILDTYRRVRGSRDFDGAIAASIRDILVSPDFLFRLEFDPQNAAASQVHKVNDFELASRLSFFLWSSIPDDELLEAARRGRLSNRAELDKQVRRMLADQRADALVDNFAAQWLGLQNIAEAKPDPIAYPQFDAGLRDAYQQETRLFMRSILRENHSVLDVVNGDYTYLNERLADLYGIPGVKGPVFRRVQLADDSPRRGVLGEGGILMATSHTDHTSPVLRGKWVLDNLLNAPPPPPPPGVPPLDTSPANGRVLTTREQVERHRASPVCASCHSRMDPYGFALENFDVLGRWRTKDAGGAIDATGQLPNGQKFTGPSGLRETLAAHPDQFVGATVSRMMTYALGRRLDAQDQPTVRDITRKTAPGGYRFNDIVLAIVDSTPFQSKQARGSE